MQRSAFTLLMLGVLCVSRTAKADVILVEGFDQATIPTGWTCSNDAKVTYVTAGTSPVASPYEGTHFVKFASAGAASGMKAQLKSPAISTVGMTGTKVVFALFGQSGTLLDGVALQYSTDGTTWITVTNYYRKNFTDLAWTLITCNYPAITTNQPVLYIAFEFVAGGSSANLYIDYARVLALPNYIESSVTVTNVTASQTGNSKYVDITYDLLNPAGGTCEVAVEVSTNSGATYVVRNSTNMTGDVGLGISVGLQKIVEWFAYYTGGDLPGDIYPDARVRVTATDMVYIPAGAFMMGSNSFTDGLGNDPTDAAPRHQVTLSAYWMDKYEVTSQQYWKVYMWATNNGYSFAVAGAVKAPKHPVHSVNWYDCVKWCNARSQMEGLTPCYYTSATKTPANVYKGVPTSAVDIQNGWVNWTTNGYRLPTEAEWEKAARGGAVAMRFPWSDAYIITNSRANYNGDTTYKYDLGPNGYNPRFDDATEPYTSPAGYFAPNGYGLYDMTGNVMEWCWDWYDVYGSASVTDPQGPSDGTERVLRGGSWNYLPTYSRVARRAKIAPDSTRASYMGFRCVRR